MLNAFLLLSCAYAVDTVDSFGEASAWVKLEARGAVARKQENGHIVEAHLHNPKVMLMDDDLDDVARLHWCRKVLVGGETTPLGLLRLLPMKRLIELWAVGDQFDYDNVRPFCITRPEVEVTPARAGKL
jgi:hypothetical protein